MQYAEHLPTTARDMVAPAFALAIALSRRSAEHRVFTKLPLGRHEMNESQPWRRPSGALAVLSVGLVVGKLMASGYPLWRRPAVAERRRGGGR